MKSESTTSNFEWMLAVRFKTLQDESASGSRGAGRARSEGASTAILAGGDAGDRVLSPGIRSQGKGQAGPLYIRFRTVAFRR